MVIFGDLLELATKIGRCRLGSTFYLTKTSAGETVMSSVSDIANTLAPELHKFLLEIFRRALASQNQGLGLRTYIPKPRALIWVRGFCLLS